MVTSPNIQSVGTAMSGADGPGPESVHQPWERPAARPTGTRPPTPSPQGPPPSGPGTRGVLPPAPGMLQALRLSVIVPSAAVLLPLTIFMMIVEGVGGGPYEVSVAVRTISDGRLGVGDIYLCYLIPAAGVALSGTMGRGHAIDRWLFTLLAVVWPVWLHASGSVGEDLRPAPYLLALLTLGAAWSPQMNQWIRLVAAHEAAAADAVLEGGSHG